MLSAAEFVRQGLTGLHKTLDTSIADLTPEQLHAVPGGSSKANTIAWNVWHLVRTEDNVVRFVLQNRRPPVWNEGGYAAKLGLPETNQGTGQSTADAQALRIKDVALFKEYMQKVWASTDEYFAKVDPADLEKTVTVKPLGDMLAIQAIGRICLTHAMSHVGEIELSRTLLGVAPTLGA
jgi:DinB family protein